MGRPRKYSTDIERRAANAASAKRYYYRNQEAILEIKRGKYDTTHPLPTSQEQSPEEKAQKDREKSRRCYAKNKSRIKVRRRGSRARGNGTHQDGVKMNSSAWEVELAALNSEYTDAMAPWTCPVQYSLAFAREHGIGRQSSTDAYDRAAAKFSNIQRKLTDYQSRVLNRLGAGAPMKESTMLSSKVKSAIQCLEELELARLSETPVERLIADLEREVTGRAKKRFSGSLQ